MKSTLLIGVVALAFGCAGMQTRADDGGPSGRWQGYLLRGGLRTPLAVELTRSSEAWQGSLSAGDKPVPLERIRVTPTTVHFELASEWVFEGSIAGDAIAGSILGAGASGSFALERQVLASVQDGPYWSGQ